MSPHAIVLCGSRRRTDPWHDLAGTGHAAAAVISGQGVTTRLTSRPLDMVVDGTVDADLLVVNLSDNRFDSFTGPDGLDWVPLGAAIAAHVAAGRPVLVLHSSVMAFPDLPGWASVLGARWVDDVSMHPDIGDVTVQVHPGPWGIGTGLEDVTVTDERYCFLEPAADLGPVEPHLTHVHDGVVHPLAWAREIGPANARVVFDALGHDVRSYDSPTRRALLAAEVDWLLRSERERAPRSTGVPNPGR